MENEDIINSIKSGKAKMHSRAYFIVRTALAIIGAVAIFFLILFVATFMIFALQENGGFFATNFGPGGWGVFLESLPWSLLLLSIALILILWILLRRYSVVYHQPFLYVLLILLAAISLVCFLVSVNAIHAGIFRYASRNGIPVVAGVYEFETAPMSGVYRGQVVLIASSSFILGNPIGQTSTVVLTPGILSELEDLGPGDYVIVFGHPVATATIQAFGVEKITNYE